MGIVTAALLSSVEPEEGTKKFSLFHLFFFSKGIVKHHDKAVGEAAVSIGNKLRLTEGCVQRRYGLTLAIILKF